MAGVSFDLGELARQPRMGTGLAGVLGILERVKLISFDGDRMVIAMGR